MLEFVEKKPTPIITYDFNSSLAVKRGEIWYADLSIVAGSEQGGERPVLIIQNDVGNQFSPTTIVAAITAQIQKAKLPTHITLSAEQYGLDRDSVVMLEQVRTIDKFRLIRKLTKLDITTMKKINQATAISLGMIDYIEE